MSRIIDADWLPDDFPWDEFTWLSKDDLKKQCAKRYLPVSGTKSVLRQRLLDYQRTRTTEVRPCPLRLEFSFPSWGTDYGCSTKPILPIVLVEDLSTFRVCFKMRFTFATHRITNYKGETETFARVQIDFTNKPSCSCGVSKRGLHFEYTLKPQLLADSVYLETFSARSSLPPYRMFVIRFSLPLSYFPGTKADGDICT